MKRLRGIAAILCTSLAAMTAFAQAPPSSAPAATVVSPPGSAKPSAAPSAAASASSAPSGAASSGNLPPGHPPTGDLPPGHPPTGDMPPGHPPSGSDSGAMPPGHPPTGDAANSGGKSPHGQGGGRRDLFEAPEDTAEDDPTLPVGTILLVLRDAQDKPIAETDVRLGIIHNTVAAGESRERKTGTTDAQGTIRWEGLTFGSGTSYRASVTRGRAQFGAPPFALGDRAGKRVTMHVYATTSDVEEALVGTQGLVYIALREDSIVLEHMYGIFNLGAVAWVPENQTIELPEGYKAFNRPDSMDGVGIDEVNGKGVLRGTIGPGRHDIQFRYQVPLDGDERQTIRIELPPHVAQMRVMVESSKTMGAEVPGFPAARKTRNRDGKRVLVTEKMVTREEGGVRTLEVTLTGLPTPGPGRWVALALAMGAVAGAFAYIQNRRDQKGVDPELRRDLIDAREALLRDIVELERKHRAGEIGPKTYERLRGALLDALERLVTKIQSTPREKTKSVSANDDDA
ncbi:MAG: hypothetical protein IPK82_02110 [Polyangiaceae bacterium]|nr:hypothetical protein [Polyangiaceae bacterium]